MGRWADREPRLRWLIIGIGVVFAVQVIWTRGNFGDLFGGVSAFFTGLAFAGLVYTILLQLYNLRTQGKELQNSTRLSAIATLADIYTRQIDIMERGGLRTELWKAEYAIHRMAEEEKKNCSKLGDEEAREIVMQKDNYAQYMVHNAPRINGDPNPLFRTSFEKWQRAHRQLDRLSSELEELEAKLEGLPERQEQAPPEST